MLFRLLLGVWLAASPALAWGQTLGIYGFQRAPSGSPPSLIRKAINSNGAGTDASSISVSPLQVTAGDLLVVVCRWALNGTGGPVTATVSDTAADTFTATSSAASMDGGTLNWIQMFYAKNAIGQSSSGSVTCNFSLSNTFYPAVAVLEYSGASTSSPLDATQGAGGPLSGGSVATSNFTTAYAKEIGVCGYSVDALSNTFTPGSSFAQELIDSSAFVGVSDRTLTTMVTTNGQFSSSGGMHGEITCATFH